MGKVYAMSTRGWKHLAIWAMTLSPALSWATVESTTESFVATATLIQGNGGSGARLNTFALQSVAPAAYAGAVTAVGSGVIFDANANWTQDQFNGTNGSFYIELESGAKINVLRTDSASKTLIVPVNLSVPAVAGNTYKVRKHLTVAGIFGRNNEAGLTPGQNPTEADNVLLYDAQTQQTFTYFYSSVPGFPGWYSAGYTAASEAVVKPEVGVMVRSKTSRNAVAYMHGAAKEGVNLTPIFPGYNLIGTLKSDRGLKLSELNLYTGDSGTGIAAGSNPSAADNLILILPDTTSATYFFSNYPGFVGWYDSSFKPAANVVVPAGSAFFLQRKAPRASFYWTVPAE